METNYFEELVEFYNELLEDTRWKQAVRAGELSGKAISTLRKKNIIPKQKRESLQIFLKMHMVKTQKPTKQQNECRL